MDRLAVAKQALEDICATNGDAGRAIAKFVLHLINQPDANTAAKDERVAWGSKTVQSKADSGERVALAISTSAEPFRFLFRCTVEAQPTVDLGTVYPEWIGPVVLIETKPTNRRLLVDALRQFEKTLPIEVAEWWTMPIVLGQPIVLPVADRNAGVALRKYLNMGVDFIASASLFSPSKLGRPVEQVKAFLNSNEYKYKAPTR